MWTSGSAGQNYGAAATGRIWSVTSNTTEVAPDWIGNTVFNEMTPIIVLRNPLGSNVRATILTATLFITNTPGGIVHTRIISDRIDRYVLLSGTLRTATAGSGDAVFTLPATVTRPGFAPALQVYDETPDYEASTFTQTFNRGDAVGGTINIGCQPGDVDYGVMPATTGGNFSFNVQGAIILEPGTTTAIYAWAATTAPQGRHAIRWVEEKLVVGT